MIGVAITSFGMKMAAAVQTRRSRSDPKTSEAYAARSQFWVLVFPSAGQLPKNVANNFEDIAHEIGSYAHVSIVQPVSSNQLRRHLWSAEQRRYRFAPFAPAASRSLGTRASPASTLHLRQLGPPGNTDIMQKPP